MPKYTNNPEIFNQPVYLSEEGKADPKQILVDYFQDSSLSEVRKKFGHIQTTCLTTPHPPYNDPGNRAELIYFLERLEELVEAAHVIVNRNYAE